MISSPDRSPLRPRRVAAGWLCLLLACVAVVSGAGRAAAQLVVEVSLSRRTYMLYEPLVATVTLTNQAGRDVTLEDTDGKQWFNMEVTTADGAVIQPYDPHYHLTPLTIPSGQTLKRKIDLNPLFPIREAGSHHLRANIYLGDADKFFTSRYVTFDLAEGQLLWRQDVGVPGSSTDTREVSLMTFQRPDKLVLYVRVRDVDGPVVYTSLPLGRLVANGVNPQVMFDRQNTLHVLHEAAPSAFLYTEIAVDGEWLNQQSYVKSGQSRPSLRKTPGGDVEVHGGQPQVKETQGFASVPVAEPKLSDRPRTLPGQKKQPAAQ